MVVPSVRRSVFFADRLNECEADQGQIGEPAPATAPLSVSVRWYFLAHVSFRHWVILSCKRCVVETRRHFFRGHTCNRQSARKGLNARNWTRFWRPVF